MASGKFPQSIQVGIEPRDVKGDKTEIKMKINKNTMKPTACKDDATETTATTSTGREIGKTSKREYTQPNLQNDVEIDRLAIGALNITKHAHKKVCYKQIRPE